MLRKGKQPEPLRYERKFLITDYSYLDVEQMIKLNSACFSPIFHERVVNNIYFDTLGLKYYYDNIEGSAERLKTRVRWYGKLFGHIQNPVLEYKIKKGLLGKKESYPLKPFLLDKNFNKSEISRATNCETIPQFVKDHILSLKPTLLNSYTRKYFLSADKKFRITIDRGLSYYRLSYMGNTFNKLADHNTAVLELKYDSELEIEAKDIANMLPFALTKSSKYLQGLESVFM